MKGTRHADGKLQFNSTDVLLWDNKSTEKPYTFPGNHFNQFLRYIRSEEMRVTLFLIIVHDYSSEAVAQAQKLKAFTEEDTDIALIKDRKSTRLNSSHVAISYAVFCLKKKEQRTPRG